MMTIYEYLSQVSPLIVIALLFCYATFLILLLADRNAEKKIKKHNDDLEKNTTNKEDRD